MKRRGMTVIEMSIVLVITGIIITSAVSFFRPLIKQKVYLNEQAELNSAISCVIAYLNKNLYLLPDADTQIITNPKLRYKTAYSGLNACSLPPKETAFIIESALLPPALITAASLRALLNCPAYRILPSRFLPAISRSDGASINFAVSAKGEVYWCVTGPGQLSDAKIMNKKNAAFITLEGDSSGCNTGYQSVILGEDMLLIIPGKTVPAGVYNLNVFISSTQDMTGILDARSFSLVVNP